MKFIANCVDKPQKIQKRRQLAVQTEYYRSSLIKGWHLMSLCCGSFPPSKSLIKYLCCYLQSNISSEGDVGKFASFSLKRLQRTLATNTRRFPPSETEIEAYKERKPIILRVYLMDGKAKALEVDSSTTAQEVFTSICEKINLRMKEDFALFESLDIMGNCYADMN